MFFSDVAKYWQLLTVITLTGITIFSLLPLEELPEFPGNDKTHHLVAYCLLMLPVALRRPKHWIVIAFIFATWSGSIELIQPYVNRYGEWLDLTANCAGLLIGILLGGLINRIIVKELKNIS